MDDCSWASFGEECKRIFESLRACDEGEVASYIPQLAEAPPDQFGLSVLSVDGRRLELGDVGAGVGGVGAGVGAAGPGVAEQFAGVISSGHKVHHWEVK